MTALKNATEQAVDSEIRRLQDEGPVAASPCWCASCQADVMALSLSCLPPHYRTAYDFDTILEKVAASNIRGVVENAVERVSRYPRHNRIQGPPGKIALRIVNFSFEEGRTLIDDLVESEESPCCCETCRNDTLAYALNRYPPKYGVERNGHIDFPEIERGMIRTELASIMKQAFRVVSTHPRH